MQTRYALTLTIENKSRNKWVICQNLDYKDGFHFTLHLRPMGEVFFLTSEGHIDVGTL